MGSLYLNYRAIGNIWVQTKLIQVKKELFPKICKPNFSKVCLSITFICPIRVYMVLNLRSQEHGFYQVGQGVLIGYFTL